VTPSHPCRPRLRRRPSQPPHCRPTESGRPSG
jgi:hypothetical protein